MEPSFTKRAALKKTIGNINTDFTLQSPPAGHWKECRFNWLHFSPVLLYNSALWCEIPALLWQNELIAQEAGVGGAPPHWLLTGGSCTRAHREVFPQGERGGNEGFRRKQGGR